MFKFVVVATTLAVMSPAAQAQNFIARMSGPAEAPPNSSPGTGLAIVNYDPVSHLMRVRASFSGLLGNVTVAHIHGATATPLTGTAGVITPTPTYPGFPAGNTFGFYDRTFDMTLSSSYNAAFITANGGTPATAETAFINAMVAQRTYFNIHTSVFGGGEIRGFLVQTSAPEPGTLSLLGAVGVIGFALVRRRK
ncbi:MAG: CHRD domain-containing protein [Capsulimonadales bacterium]|nr:CHRD domain-containing protein [Capsulimonadales bacterium]